jgi:hypothetical protein
MADDNNKKNRMRIHGGAIPSLGALKDRGIKDVDTPIRPGASADSSGYFAKGWQEAKNERKDYLSNRKGYTPSEMERMEKKGGTVEGYLSDKISDAKDSFHRQGDKARKDGLLNYDKDGYATTPLSSKKEMRPAAIVAPVKRPSEAVMKKVTGKK